VTREVAEKFARYIFHAGRPGKTIEQMITECRFYLYSLRALLEEANIAGHVIDVYPYKTSERKSNTFKLRYRCHRFVHVIQRKPRNFTISPCNADISKRQPRLNPVIQLINSSVSGQELVVTQVITLSEKNLEKSQVIHRIPRGTHCPQPKANPEGGDSREKNPSR